MAPFSIWALASISVLCASIINTITGFGFVMVAVVGIIIGVTIRKLLSEIHFKRIIFAC